MWQAATALATGDGNAVLRFWRELCDGDDGGFAARAGAAQGKGGLAAILLGHHASERFSLDVLGRRLAEALPGLEWRASSADIDPLAWQAI